MNVSQSRWWHSCYCAQGGCKGALDREGSAGVHGRLGLDGLHVGVGAVRRLVLGLLVLHGVDDLVVGRRDGRARDGADDEDPEVAEVVRAAVLDVVRLVAVGCIVCGLWVSALAISIASKKNHNHA